MSKMITAKVRLGPKATGVITRRIEGGAAPALSMSEMINTVINRYGAMVDQEHPSIQKKFRTYEITALQKAIARVPDAKHRLSRLETVGDLVLFPALFEQGHMLLPEDEQLTKKQLADLIQVLTTTITVSEMSALSDRVIAYINQKGA